VKNAALVAFSTVLAGGLVPALRAARLRPVEAMRHT
jgi:ABC-type antimicrobial peptide transport system permease subunit